MYSDAKDLVLFFARNKKMSFHHKFRAVTRLLLNCEQNPSNSYSNFEF